MISTIHLYYQFLLQTHEIYYKVIDNMLTLELSSKSAIA